MKKTNKQTHNVINILLNGSFEVLFRRIFFKVKPVTDYFKNEKHHLTGSTSYIDPKLDQRCFIVYDAVTTLINIRPTSCI